MHKKLELFGKSTHTTMLNPNLSSENCGKKIQLFRVMFFINLRSVCCRHHQIALYGLTLLFSAKHSLIENNARAQAATLEFCRHHRVEITRNQRRISLVES